MAPSALEKLLQYIATQKETIHVGIKYILSHNQTRAMYLLFKMQGSDWTAFSTILSKL